MSSLAVRTPVKKPNSHIGELGFDLGLMVVMAQSIGACHPCGILGMSSQLPALASVDTWRSEAGDGEELPLKRQKG